MPETVIVPLVPSRESRLSDAEIEAALAAVAQKRSPSPDALRFCVARGFVAVEAPAEIERRTADLEQVRRDVPQQAQLQRQLEAACRKEESEAATVALLARFAEGTSKLAGIRRALASQQTILDCTRSLASARSRLIPAKTAREQLERRIRRAADFDVRSAEDALRAFFEIPGVGFAALSPAGRTVLDRLRERRAADGTAAVAALGTSPGAAPAKTVDASHLQLQSMFAREGPEAAHRKLASEADRYAPEQLLEFIAAVAQAYLERRQTTPTLILCAQFAERLGPTLPVLLLKLAEQFSDSDGAEALLNQSALRLGTRLGEVAAAYAQSCLRAGEVTTALNILQQYEPSIVPTEYFAVLAQAAQKAAADELSWVENTLIRCCRTEHEELGAVAAALVDRYAAASEIDRAWAVASRYGEALGARRAALGPVLLNLAEQEGDQLRIREIVRECGALLDPQRVQQALYFLYKEWEGDNLWAFVSVVREFQPFLRECYDATVTEIHRRMLDEDFPAEAAELMRAHGDRAAAFDAKAVARQAKDLTDDGESFEQAVDFLLAHHRGMSPDELFGRFNDLWGLRDADDETEAINRLESLLVAIAPALGERAEEAARKLIEDYIENEDYGAAACLMGRLADLPGAKAGKLAQEAVGAACESDAFAEAMGLLLRFKSTMGADQVRASVEEIIDQWLGDPSSRGEIVGAVIADCSGMLADQGRRAVEKVVPALLAEREYDTVKTLAAGLDMLASAAVSLQVQLEYERALREGDDSAAELREAFPRWCR